MEFVVRPIGTFHCDYKYKQDMPRQGVLNTHSKGEVHLQLKNAPQCLTELEGFSHIWLIYLFHQNQNWKPMVSPPRIHPKKVGVLATRAPYRPNPIGMSLVKLESVKKNILTVSEFDLLDQTPILDIKPYIHYSDSRENSLQSWLCSEPSYKIHYSLKAQQQVEWIKTQAQLNLTQAIETQLTYRPTDFKLKRVSKVDQHWVLAYRTWRVKFDLSEESSIEVLEIFSGYSAQELQSGCDKYNDKNMHKEFVKFFTEL